MGILSHADLATLCSRSYLEKTCVARNLEYLVSSVDSVTYIAIRGTETGLISDRGIFDVIRNARIIPRYTKATGWGHGGFVRGAVAVSKALLDKIPDGNCVVLTGHSLGAAVAVLCSQILHYQGYLINEVVMFGSPRIYSVVRPSFVYPVTSYRNGSDIITNVPRLYRHAVPLTLISDSGRRFPSLGDHAIEKYEAALIEAGL